MVIEIPVGDIDGVNDTFVPSVPPIGEQVYVDHTLQERGYHYVYTDAGDAIVFQAGFIPPLGAVIRIIYNLDSSPLFPYNEIPSGTVGDNNIFTTVAGPIRSEQLFVDGLLQIPGTDYSVLGNTITFTTDATPLANAMIRIFYSIAPIQNFKCEVPVVAGQQITLSALPQNGTIRLYIDRVLQVFGIDCYSTSSSMVLISPLNLTNAYVYACYLAVALPATISRSVRIQPQAPVQAVDYGEDISCYPDYSPLGTLVSKSVALCQRIARRYSNPRGAWFWAPNECTDLRGYLNTAFTGSIKASMQSDSIREAMREDQVQSANADIIFDSSSQTINLNLFGTTSDGPFAFVMSVSATSVQILKSS